MVRPIEATPAGPHRRKGAKANKKQMACIGGVYTVEAKVRTPQDKQRQDAEAPRNRHGAGVMPLSARLPLFLASWRLGVQPG